MNQQYGLNKYVQFGLIGFLGGFCVSFFTAKTLAQQSNIIPDNTLGAESSRFNPNVVINGINADSIDRGARRGSNLFHSFSQFNINNGQSLYFVNPAGVKNILTRVTGGNASNILGTLGVAGGANLFLINPAGILFGENARLDVQGSFVGTTANGVQFGEQGLFSATNPEVPGLLTVNPSALFFNQLNQGKITVKSQASSGISPTGGNATGLRVPDGQSLLLVGGNVNIDGGGLKAYGGNIELAGLSAPGNVGLNFARDNISLDIPDGVERADISLSNRAEINVLRDNGGSIKINARNVELNQRSQMWAGIDSGLGTPESKGGDIVINATGTTTLTDNTLIANVVNDKAFGKAGDIDITTNVLSVTNRALLDASTFGNGDAGSVVINASDTVSFNQSGVFSRVVETGVGKGGGINITTGSFFLTNSAQLTTSTFGNGDAGRVAINASNAVSLDTSSILSKVENTGVGKGGTIDITANSLSLTNQARILASTQGNGNAGNVVINADNVSLDRSAVFSRVAETGEGKGGKINITAGSLFLTNSAQLTTSTFGNGDAGRVVINATDAVTVDTSSILSKVEKTGEGKGGTIDITTNSLSLSNQARILASTEGKGDAGRVVINARDTVSFDGSGILSRIVETGEGEGGTIDITTGSLFLTNSAQLTTSTFGKGDAGRVVINANDAVSLDTSSILSKVENTGAGKGGTIEIITDSLSLSNISQIATTTSGEFPAGDITLNVQDSITMSGSETGLFANTVQGSTGKGGSIIIDPRTMIIRDGAKIAVDSQGTGIGGDIELIAGFLTLDRGTISAETRSNTGGNITLNLQNILLLRNGNGSQISTTAGNQQFGGDGGNITINSPFIVAIPKENSDISANAFSGRGGKVEINSQGIFGIESRPKPTALSDITASSQIGISGETNINTADTSSIQNSFTELSPTIDTSAIIANSCIARSNKRKENSFTITGSGALPANRPGDVLVSTYTTGEVRGVETTFRSWKKGDPIIEPQGLYRLNNGQLLLSRECSN